MASYEQAKSLLRHSVARPTLYSLELKSAKGMTDLEAEYIKLFCNNIQFPGVDYEQVVTIGQEAMGIQRSIPAGLMFGSGNRLLFTVIENSDFGVYDSLRRVFNSATAQGANPIGNNRAQRMNYYDDFKFNVVLRKLEFPNTERQIPDSSSSAIDFGYKVVATYTFQNCYLTMIGPVTYDSNERNTLMTFTGTLAFENYHHDDKKYMYGQERAMNSNG